MTTREPDNEAVVQRFIGELVNDENYDLVGEIFTEDHTRHDPASPESEPGLGPWFESMRDSHRAFPDGEVHIGELVAEGDLVSFEGTTTGTHQGDLRGIEPTTASVEIQRRRRAPRPRRPDRRNVGDSGFPWATDTDRGRRTSDRVSYGF